MWQDGNYCEGHNQQQLTWCSIRLDCSHHVPTISTTTTAHTLKHLPQCLDKTALKSKVKTPDYPHSWILVLWHDGAGAQSVNFVTQLISSFKTSFCNSIEFLMTKFTQNSIPSQIESWNRKISSLKSDSLRIFPGISWLSSNSLYFFCFCFYWLFTLKLLNTSP